VSNPVTFKAVTPAVPATPGSLAATSNATTGATTLNWTAATPGTGSPTGTTISYLVSVNGAAGVPMANGATLAVATGASYTVQVATVATYLGLTATSAYSTPVTVDLTAAATPNAPATLTVSATALNWTAPAALAGTGSTNVAYTYTVQQSINGSAWTTLTSTPITARTLPVTQTVGNSYQYQVTAQATRYGLTASAASTPKATTYAVPAANTTPVAALTKTGVRGITVTWTNTSNFTPTFTVQRRLAGGAWATIAATVTNAGTTYSFSDATMGAAGSYSYHVLATGTSSTAYKAASNAVVTP
jgi:hypothetical protein